MLYNISYARTSSATKPTLNIHQKRARIVRNALQLRFHTRSTHTHSFRPMKGHACLLSAIEPTIFEYLFILYLYFERQNDHRLVTSGVQYNANDTGPERIFSQKRR